MRFSRTTTILLIVLLVLVGIVGTYFWLRWVGIYNLWPGNFTRYTDEELKTYISDFIERQFGPEFKPSDIFVFTNTPYYISVIEKDSGQGAFELLFNPDIKKFQPEPGPNMMWNQKYGMMGNSGWRGFEYNSQTDYSNQVTRQEALKYAQLYLNEERPDVKVGNEGHEFYGYYTFHTIRDNEPYGMLSVNGITGEVWYHDWHGRLDHIIEMEQHDDHNSKEEE